VRSVHGRRYHAYRTLMAAIIGRSRCDARRQTKSSARQREAELREAAEAASLAKDGFLATVCMSFGPPSMDPRMVSDLRISGAEQNRERLADHRAKRRAPKPKLIETSQRIHRSIAGKLSLTCARPAIEHRSKTP